MWLITFRNITSSRRKKKEERGKREEERGKRKEERRKKKEERRKKKEEEVVYLTPRVAIPFHKFIQMRDIFIN